jgi:broad specificity phosphatase PhoE
VRRRRAARRAARRSLLWAPCLERAANPRSPSLARAGSSQEEDLDGFVLHSQPTYERVLSQRVAEPDGAAPGDSQAVADTQFDAALLSQRPGAGAAPSEACSSQPLPSGSNSTGAAPLAPAPGDPPAARQGLTPAVHSVDRVQLNNANANANAPASLFPIFRSRRDCKTVYIVRHGESEYNAATAAAGSGWADPLIYDAPLTAKGQAQARALLHAITQWDLPKDVLWACSPLTRAVETMLLACPDPRVRAGAAVHVLPDISEKVFTSGDVGRPPAVLSQRFPELAPCLASLPETWWYTTEARPNCALQRAFNAHEPRASVERRVKAFRQWVLGRPESVIVAFGHSSYWKAFATAANNGVRVEALPNCGWMKLHI